MPARHLHPDLTHATLQLHPSWHWLVLSMKSNRKPISTHLSWLLSAVASDQCCMVAGCYGPVSSVLEASGGNPPLEAVGRNDLAGCAAGQAVARRRRQIACSMKEARQRSGEKWNVLRRGGLLLGGLE
jgi:hypothetical protein